MREITLVEYLETHTQQEAAEILGRTQGAVWQMLRANRDVRFRIDASGNVVSHYEIKAMKHRRA